MQTFAEVVHLVFLNPNDYCPKNIADIQIAQEISFFLRFYCGVFFILTVLLKLDWEKIATYRLAYGVAIYHNILYHNFCIMIRIISPDSCQ